MNITFGRIVCMFLSLVVPGYICVFFLSIYYYWIKHIIFGVESNHSFVSLVLLSLAFGVIVDAVRSVILDQLHHFSGVRLPASLNSVSFRSEVRLHVVAMDNYYRYQWLGNSFVALVFVGLFPSDVFPYPGKGDLWTAPVYVFYCISLIALYFASRFSLKKYYRQVEELSEMHATLRDEEKSQR